MALFDSKAKIIQGYEKSINDKNLSIKRYYDEIGRLYYGQYKDNNVDVTKDINNRCDAVTKLYRDIEELKHKILFEKGLKLCPACKTENNLEYAFCFKCGNKFDPESSKRVIMADEYEQMAAEPEAEDEVEVIDDEDVVEEEKTEDEE
ncbi:hypothetical protein SAMN02910456_01606 [Ruminococcaceae bacterium YRB3002]|nr:hypothetical protein SAMN02910456_01606 [Ruminococcaceae bacterium YRB3002]